MANTMIYDILEAHHLQLQQAFVEQGIDDPMSLLVPASRRIHGIRRIDARVHGKPSDRLHGRSVLAQRRGKNYSARARADSVGRLLWSLSS